MKCAKRQSKLKTASGKKKQNSSVSAQPRQTDAARNDKPENKIKRVINAFGISHRSPIWMCGRECLKCDAAHHVYQSFDSFAQRDRLCSWNCRDEGIMQGSTRFRYKFFMLLMDPADCHVRYISSSHYPLNTNDSKFQLTTNQIQRKAFNSNTQNTPLDPISARAPTKLFIFAVTQRHFSSMKRTRSTFRQTKIE